MVLEPKWIIKRIFYTWRIISDGFYRDQFSDEYEDDIKDLFSLYKEYYGKEHFFLFYIGFIMDVEPWTLVKNYSENSNYYDNLGKDMITKAYEMMPLSLYRWALSNDIEERKKLGTQIIQNQDFPIKGGEIEDYFIRLLKNRS